MDTKNDMGVLPYLAGILLILAHACGAGYLENTLSGIKIVQLGLYVSSLFLSTVVLLKRRRRPNREFVLILAFFLYLSVITFINDASIRNVASYIFSFAAFSLFILCINYYEMMTIMRFWVVVLALLIAIDLYTMYRYPTGLYTTVHARSVYTINWFLGYKTARIAYSLPMLICLAISNISRKGTTGKTFVALSLLVIWDTYMSYGTTALIGVLFFAIGAFVVSQFYYATDAVPRFIAFFLSPQVFFFLLVVFWLYTVILQDNEVFFTSISGFLDKSSTLSGRTRIWESCINAVKQSGWMGIGVVDRDMMEIITNGMVNAHSQLLTILLNGGVPAVIWYMLLAYLPMRYKGYVLIDYILQLSIYTFFLMGLVSSTLTYSPILFMILVLIDKRRNDSLCLAK